MVPSAVYRAVLLATLVAGFGWTWWQWQSILPFLLLIGGVVVGGIIVSVDHLFGMQWYQPLEGVPITRSSLFMISLLPLTIFVITSAGSILGTGVMIGLLTTLAWQILPVTSLSHMHDTVPITRHLPAVSVTLYQSITTAVVVVAMILAVMSWN